MFVLHTQYYFLHLPLQLCIEHWYMFIVVPFLDFLSRPIFCIISTHIKFNYQICDCNIFYSIHCRYLTHIIINFLSIHLL